MKSYSNIETRKNIDGSRTGYDASGRSWRIYGASGCWHARANVTTQGLENMLFGYERLSEISALLKGIGIKPR